MGHSPQFIHLRTHSDYSIVNGLPKVKSLVQRVNELAMPAVALTDQSNLCGLVKFYRSCLSSGIKPIVGADIYVGEEALVAPEFSITLLAMNQQGYQNLTELISRAYQQGYRLQKPQIKKEWLAELSEGLIVLSGATSGDLGQALLKENTEQVKACVEFYQTHFTNRFYLELVRTGRDEEESYIHAAVECAQEYDLPVVATNHVLFLNEEEFDAHEIRVAIHDGYTLADPKRPKLYSKKQYLRSEEEMLALFSDIPSALENSVEIAKRCNVSIRLDEPFLPNFPTGDLSTDDYLIQVSQQGLEERLENLYPDQIERETKRAEYQSRLKIELDVINQMGFPGYFLIVMEFIQWAKDQNIPVGPGRGSGAGSLVAYALKITDLDPLEFDLLFERFLNPERVSMPDFDVDFCMDRRDEVIEHTAQMYGRDAVSQIITFGTMAAKAVIRDVGRVLGHPYGFVDRIAKLIPMDPGMTLAKAFEAEPMLTELYDHDDDVQELIDMARTLEGVTRNAGKHAGGVVIAPTKITDFSPLYCDDAGENPVTQFDKNDVEAAGLVKFDFLGLRTLTIIQWTLNLLNEQRLKENQPSIMIDQIEMNDSACFDLLKRAETTAVFQLESRGMKDLIKRLQPDCFEDIIALVALFRPGPLQSGMVDNFIDRKHGREAISYPDERYQHESLQPILEPTYGIILYQEQVMQIAQELAGYTLGGADMLRRAMGKKKPEEMAKQREVFEQGAREQGIDGELAIKIFDLVEKFAGYGFNKSHSAAYALVSYQTLWLKTHYPSYFMAAVLSADMDNTDKVVTLVEECQRLGLAIVPPDVNKSYHHFTVDDKNQIIYGLGAIKGVGEGAVENMIQEREHRPFRDLFDFCARLDLKKNNKRVLEKLILSGAMDHMGTHRRALIETLPEAMAAAQQHAQAQAHGQTDLFGLLNDDSEEEIKQTFVDCQPWSPKTWLNGERDTLGFYLTGHPIDQYSQEVSQYTKGRLIDVHPTKRGELVKIVGLVMHQRIVTTKRGTKMAVLTLDDKSARIDVVLFGEVYEQNQHLLEQYSMLYVEGDVSYDDFSGGNKMTARTLMTLDMVRAENVLRLELDLCGENIDNVQLTRLIQLLTEFRGETTPIQCHYRKKGVAGCFQLPSLWCVNLTDDLIFALESLLGKNSVRMIFN